MTAFDINERGNRVYFKFEPYAPTFFPVDETRYCRREGGRERESQCYSSQSVTLFFFFFGLFRQILQAQVAQDRLPRDWEAEVALNKSEIGGGTHTKYLNLIQC